MLPIWPLFVNNFKPLFFLENSVVRGKEFLYLEKSLVCFMMIKIKEEENIRP